MHTKQMKAERKKDRGVLKEIDDLTKDAEYDLRPVPIKRDGSLVKYDPLQMYLWEIRRYKLLTKEEEIELAIRYRQ